MHNYGCRLLSFFSIPLVGLPETKLERHFGSSGKVEVLFVSVKYLTRFHRMLRYVRVRLALYISCALLSYHVIEVVK